MNKQIILSAAGTLTVAFLLQSCVSTSTHQKEVGALKTEVDQAKIQIDQLKTTNQSLNDEKNKTLNELVSITKDRGQMKASLEEMKLAMEELKLRQAEQKKRLQDFEDLNKKLKALTDSGALTINFIDGKMVVSLGSDILFSTGSSKLSANGLATLKEVTLQLKSLSDKKYQIEGHTDNVPIATATFPSNWELAAARAINVTKFMIESGMPAERVSAASYADTNPRQPNETNEGKASNRRIAIVIMPDLTSLPGYKELNKINK